MNDADRDLLATDTVRKRSIDAVRAAGAPPAWKRRDRPATVAGPLAGIQLGQEKGKPR